MNKTMTPFTAYKKLKKAFPQHEFHITTGANSSYFNATIYVTNKFNDITNSIFEANSFDDKDPVSDCFNQIMKKLTTQ